MGSNPTLSAIHRFMRQEIRLDEVSTFSDKLRFLIPHEWIEGEAEDSTYLYHAPDTDSGWFRTSLVTVDSEEPENRLREIAKERGDLVKNDHGNFVQSYEKDTVEDGDAIHIFYWYVFAAVPPNFVREAIFSYTTLQERLTERETIETINLLGELVGRAIFPTPEH